MEIKDLLLTTGPDVELFDQVCKLIQEKYAEYSEAHFYIRLCERDSGQYQVDEIKNFDNFDDQVDFILDERTYDPCIRFKKSKNCVEAQLISCHHFISVEISVADKKIRCFSDEDYVKILRSAPFSPREMAAGFLEIGQELKIRTLKKAA